MCAAVVSAVCQVCAAVVLVVWQGVLSCGVRGVLRCSCGVSGCVPLWCQWSVRVYAAVVSGCLRMCIVVVSVVSQGVYHCSVSGVLEYVQLWCQCALRCVEL